MKEQVRSFSPLKSKGCVCSFLRHLPEDIAARVNPSPDTGREGERDSRDIQV